MRYMIHIIISFICLIPSSHSHCPSYLILLSSRHLAVADLPTTMII